MESLWQAALTNTALAALLALAAWLIARVGARPIVCHAVWLIVLMRLAMPPLLAVSLPLPAWIRGWSNVARENVAAVGVGPTETATESRADAANRTTRVEPDRPRANTFSWASIGAGVWIVGSCCWFVLVWRRIRGFNAMLARTHSATPELMDTAAACAKKLGLRNCPDIRVAEGRLPPLVWAARLRPIVVLPLPLLAGLSSDELATLISHELAHIRRKDHWICRLELLVLGCYWWNPVAWWASKNLRHAEEACCDAVVVRALPDKARDYGMALLKAAEFLSAERTPLPAAAIGFGEGTSIKRRIEMILSGNLAERVHPATRLSIALVALLGLGTSLQLALGDESAGQEASQSTKEIQDLKVEVDRLKSELRKPVGPLSKSQIRLELIVAEVSEKDWPEVEKILSPFNRRAERKQSVKELFDTLQQRKLLHLLARPQLGTTDGTTAFLGLDSKQATDAGKAAPERWQIEITCFIGPPAAASGDNAARADDRTITAAVRFREATGEKATTRTREVESALSLKVGQMDVVPVTAHLLKAHSDFAGSNKLVFVTPIEIVPPAKGPVVSSPAPTRR